MSIVEQNSMRRLSVLGKDFTTKTIIVPTPGVEGQILLAIAFGFRVTKENTV